MSINLDEIISSSTSVDDLVKALAGEQQGTQKAAQQLMQLAEASRGSMNPVQWIKDNVSPRSTAGTLSNDSDYKQHVIQATENGEEPMTREEYNKMREKTQSNPKQKARG